MQPVVLIDTTSCYDIKKYFYTPKDITVVYMESFIADKSDKNWLKDLRVKMQKVYDDELANNTRNR